MRLERCNLSWNTRVVCNSAFWVLPYKTCHIIHILSYTSATVSIVHITVAVDYWLSKNISMSLQHKMCSLICAQVSSYSQKKLEWILVQFVYFLWLSLKCMNMHIKHFLSSLLIHLFIGNCWENSIVWNRGPCLCFYTYYKLISNYSL
jgi:hypothetical protein